MTTPAIKLFTKPNCSQCVQTKNALAMLGIKEDQIETVKLEEHPEMVAVIKEKYKAQMAPVVIVSEDNFWTGFNMNKLKEFAASLTAPIASPCAI